VSNPEMIIASLENTPLLAVIGAAVFGGVFFMSMAVARVLSARGAIRQRALKDFALAGILEDSSGAWLDRRSVSHQRLVGASRIVLAAATKFGPSDRQAKASMRMDMVKSGFFDTSAIYWYFSARVLSALALPIIFLLVVQFLPYSFSATWMIVAVACLSLAGYVLPGFYLHRRQIHLQQQFRHGFPDFMDLMVVCAETGISPAAAIDRVGRELAVTYPYLGANLHLVTLELRAGQALTTAMNNLADRVGLEEVNSLAGLLRQSEELGTSLAEALRVYSLEMRDKRLSRAEEKAHALPVVLMVPLGLFIFPVMMISIMLPLILRFKAIFF
jgi:tight adherence protein C